MRPKMDGVDDKERMILRRLDRRIWERLAPGRKIEVVWHPRTPNHAFLPPKNRVYIGRIARTASARHAS